MIARLIGINNCLSRNRLFPDYVDYIPLFVKVLITKSPLMRHKVVNLRTTYSFLLQDKGFSAEFFKYITQIEKASKF